MTCLAVLLFRDGVEVDVASLDDSHQRLLGRECIAIWRMMEYHGVSFVVRRDEHGRLGVHAGQWDECRCSDSEIKLADEDFDDHHFVDEDLPSDIAEWYLLYQETDILRQRFMTRDAHPLFNVGHTELKGCQVRFQVCENDHC